MGLVSEFKTFIIKGNAIDMAVGIIIGAAFGVVVKTLVDKIVMPPLGYLLGGIDFDSYGYTLAEAIKEGEKHPVTQFVVQQDVPAVVIGYGAFIGTIINLLIVGLAVFMVVKVINSMKKKEEEAPSAPPADIQLLTEIRDALKK